MAGEHWQTVSIRPWIAAGDDTTCTIHKSHSKQQASQVKAGLVKTKLSSLQLTARIADSKNNWHIHIPFQTKKNYLEGATIASGTMELRYILCVAQVQRLQLAPLMKPMLRLRACNWQLDVVNTCQTRDFLNVHYSRMPAPKLISSYYVTRCWPKHVGYENAHIKLPSSA